MLHGAFALITLYPQLVGGQPLNNVPFLYIWLLAASVPETDFGSNSTSDGKGGISSDRVVPQAVVKLLSIMAGRQDFPTFYDALSIIAGDSLNQRGFFLTKGLAGYLAAQSGRELIFALYVNGFFVSSMEEIMAVGKDMGSTCLAICQANPPAGQKRNWSRQLPPLQITEGKPIGHYFGLWASEGVHF